MAINEQSSYYFRIGSFVITGITLIIIAILLLGSGKLFQKVIYTETYFKESVQGLTEGSPVKYLGMEIGTVKEINAVDNIYHEAKNLSSNVSSRYIYVKMAILPKFFASSNDYIIDQEIHQYITNGLRVKLAPQGLTGNSYLELVFLPPASANTLITINWHPKNYYIPSTTSTLAYFTENAQYILSELRKVDFKGLFDHIDTLVTSTKDVVNRADNLLSQTNQQMISTINNMRNISANISSISEQAKMHPSSLLFGEPPPRLDPKKL